MFSPNLVIGDRDQEMFVGNICRVPMEIWTAIALKMGYEEIGDHFATFTDLKEPMRILAFSDRREDAEAEIIFFAYDEVGREMRLSNEVAPGIPVPLKQASVRSFFSIAKDITTTEKLRTPYQITKSVTRGYVTVYGWDEKANDLVWLTTMAPDEECAEYRRYKFAGTPVSIQALVQLNPIRQFQTRLPAYIQLPEFYRDMARALKEKDMQNMSEFEKYRNNALDMLALQNEQKRDRNNYATQNIATNAPAITASLRGGRRFS